MIKERVKEKKPIKYFPKSFARTLKMILVCVPIKKDSIKKAFLEKSNLKVKYFPL